MPKSRTFASKRGFARQNPRCEVLRIECVSKFPMSLASQHIQATWPPKTFFSWRENVFSKLLRFPFLFFLSLQLGEKKLFFVCHLLREKLFSPSCLGFPSDFSFHRGQAKPNERNPDTVLHAYKHAFFSIFDEKLTRKTRKQGFPIGNLNFSSKNLLHAKQQTLFPTLKFWHAFVTFLLQCATGITV